MGAIVIVDAFWGDAGKGKLCAYLTRERDANLCVRAGTGTNAGHSFYIDSVFVKSQLIPMGTINSKVKGLVSSGVCVDPNIFIKEIETYGLHGVAYLDYRCPIIEPSHIRYEQDDHTMHFIDSTKSGSGRARAEFVMRRAKQAKDIEALKPFLIDGIREINHQAKNGLVILEGSQATHLSLYASDRYPYVTSDNCTTAAFLDDASLNWQLVDEVVLIVKCLPTCIGNGPLPYEMSREEIKNMNLEEFGINTKRPKRRSKMIDYELLSTSIIINGPTCLALTFCDQYCHQARGIRKLESIPREILDLKLTIEEKFNIPIKYLSTGPDLNDMVSIQI